MSTQRSLITLCFATVFALGLAACGGGGGDRAMVPVDPVDPVVDPVDPGPTPEAKTKAAGTKAKLIADWTPADTLGGLADGPETPGAYTLSIKRDNPTTIEIKDPAMPRTTDPKFELAEDLGDGRFMFVRTQDADEDGNVEEEVVIVGTDIRAPRALPFGRVHMLTDRDLDPEVDADEDGTKTNDFTAIMVLGEGDDDPAVAVRKLVKSDAFTATKADILTFAFNNTTTDKDEAKEVDGYYNGAKGTYRCNGTAMCTVDIGTVEGKLTITDMSVGWIFTPDPGVTSDVADSSYLHYGFWLKNTTDEDGVLTYNELETFAGASVDASGAVTTVQGTASYTGDAVGVYVHNVLSDGGGMVESSTSGHFKADASLTATFGQITGTGPNVDSIPPSLENTITGTINNFDLSGDEENDWSVNLAKSADFVDGVATGDAHGGGAAGRYSATFHGMVQADDPTVQPSAVVGEFNAHFSNGSVAGGFGANKQ